MLWDVNSLLTDVRFHLSIKKKKEIREVVPGGRHERAFDMLIIDLGTGYMDVFNL